ncbi:MAG: hypothetical protein NTW84_07820 [Methanothrix sp.]|nr:hypothetical protein [Methanothrix sp.]
MNQVFHDAPVMKSQGPGDVFFRDEFEFFDRVGMAASGKEGSQDGRAGAFVLRPLRVTSQPCLNGSSVRSPVVRG